MRSLLLAALMMGTACKGGGQATGDAKPTDADGVVDAPIDARVMVDVPIDVYVPAINPTSVYVKASNTPYCTGFGGNVAMSSDGNTVAIGCAGDWSNSTGINNSGSNNLAGQSGAVHVYVKSGSSWSYQAYVKASNTEENDLFGTSVALSADGNTLAVGAIGEDSNGTSQTNNSRAESGAVYVFTRSGTTWTQQAYIKAAPDVDDYGPDHFGTSLSLAADGNTLAVSATGEDSNAVGINGDHTDDSALSSGAVFVFARSGATWSQQAYVKASNAEQGDVFGFGLSLSGDGNKLAVGSMFESSDATGIGGNQSNNQKSSSGAVYAFARTNTTWTQTAYIKASKTDYGAYFGVSVAWSEDGSTLAVGAQHVNAVYVFTHNGTFVESMILTAINRELGDEFGRHVAVSSDGGVILVGASREDGAMAVTDPEIDDDSLPNSGAAYVFTRINGAWYQNAFLKASNPDMHDYFGSDVAMSAAGNQVVIGATGEGSLATGIGGNQNDNSMKDKGAAYLISW